MQVYWDRFLSGSLAIAALAIAGILIHREFWATQAPPSSVEAQRFETNWREVLPAGRLVGDSGAPVTVVVLSDLECPFCKMFHETLLRTIEKYPRDVAYVFVHFPLRSHRSALGAAKFSECASAAGKFDVALDFIFANQESLGARDWQWFAEGIGVKDHPGYVACMADTKTPALIERGLAVGAKMAVRGTPVVFLNGWRYPGAPPEVEFIRAVDDLVAGKPPYADFPRNAIGARER